MVSNIVVIDDDDSDNEIIMLSGYENYQGLDSQQPFSPIDLGSARSSVDKSDTSTATAHDHTRNPATSITQTRDQRGIAMPERNSSNGQQSAYSQGGSSAAMMDSEHEWKDLEDLEDDVLKIDDVYRREEKTDPVQPPKKPTTAARRINSTDIEPLNSPRVYQHKNLYLKPKKTVELQDGDFLRIKEILRISGNDIILRGHRLQRTRDLNGTLVKKLNELCLFYEVCLDDPQEPDKQCVVDIPVSDVKGLRLLQQTNQIFPRCRDVEGFVDNEDASNRGKLVVRWKYICKYDSALARDQNKWTERALEHIQEADSEKEYRVSDAAICFEWRGDTVLGGAHRPIGRIKDQERIIREDDGSSHRVTTATTKTIPQTDAQRAPSEARKHRLPSGTDDSDPGSLKKRQCLATEQTTQKMSNMTLMTSLELGQVPSEGVLRSKYQSFRGPVVRSVGQKYTYGDAFCGAGGSTRGAEMAGLQVKWGFDFWAPACASWSANFPSAVCYHMASHLFVSRANKGADVKVDILHLSPPCQYFSPAHTVAGKNDQMNLASLFAVLEVIKATRPRIVTLEQTFGICTTKFRYYFNALVQQFSSVNFSVRWAIVPLQNWGLPQRRHRLIIFASCPGEILPKIPRFTHSEDGKGDLEPFTTVNETLERVETYIKRYGQDLILDNDPKEQVKTAYNGDHILPRAMTTHGGQNHHPNGKRDLTLHEYAAMQGFPLNHIFKGPSIKQQIGNAVPPSVAKVLFKSIITQLHDADGVIDSKQSEEVDLTQ